MKVEERQREGGKKGRGESFSDREKNSDGVITERGGELTSL